MQFNYLKDDETSSPMSGLDGWKALIFLCTVTICITVLAALHIVDGEFIKWAIIFTLGGATGNTVLKKHQRDYARLKAQERQRLKTDDPGS